MTRIFRLLALLLTTSFAFASPSLTVDCDQGQSLNQTLARMSKVVPLNIAVKGTCTEYVFVDGFNGLTLTGLPGATLQQPSNDLTGLFYVLSLTDSRNITVTGLTLHSRSTPFSVVGVGKGSSSILLKNLQVDGSWGIVVYENSQVWISKSTITVLSNYAGVSSLDSSDVHITDTLVRSGNSDFHAGLLVSAGHVTMQGVTIRDMSQSIVVNASGILDLVNFDSTAGKDVIIDNPAGNNNTGVLISDSSSLNVNSVVLRVNNAGQPWGWNSGAIVVTNGSTMNAESYNGGAIVVSNSQGQGVLVSNNSHAELAGASITGGLHGGLVVTNLSTATVTTIGSQSTISGNATDLFCDSKSELLGSSSIANASTVQCGNLFPGTYESLP